MLSTERTKKERRP